jgi:xylulose-5-phosphate/fructose-6-phosphate phosphoketolase
MEALTIQLRAAGATWDDVIDRVPGLAAHSAYAKQVLRDKLIDHREYITLHGEDMPEVRDWTWPY